MKKLIRLELDRLTLRPHIIGVIIANIIILLLSVFSSIIISSGTSIPSAAGIQTMQLDTITMATLLTKAVLIVWESVFISLIVISEFQNKTIDVIFTYPINRKKLFLVKLLMICMIMVVFYVGSYVFQNFCISILSQQFEFVSYSFVNIFMQIISIVSAVFIGLLVLAIGLIRQSSIATVVSSLIIVAIASNSQGTTAGLISIPIFSGILGVIGVVISVVAIRKIVASDLHH